MNPSNYRVRRATLEDLGTLKTLWAELQLTISSPERRLTEFQVAEDSEGRVVGSVGFVMSQRHALIHNEAYSDFALADILRPMLWNRIQALCLNHGVARLWTLERSPFWKRNGFLPATNETMQKLPPAWANSSTDWLTLQLKDEEAVLSMEKEVALIMQTERQRTSKTVEQAKTIKTVLMSIGLLIAFGILFAAVYLYLRGGIPVQPR